MAERGFLGQQVPRSQRSKELELKQLQSRNHELETALENQRSRTIKQASELAQLNAALSKLQKDGYQQMKLVKGQTMGSSEIGNRLRTLRNDIEAFGRAHAIDAADGLNMASGEPQSNASGIEQALAEVVRFDEPEAKIQDELRGRQRWPMLCLTGLLSLTVCRQMFDDPFSFLNGEPFNTRKGSLFQIYSAAKRFDYTAVHIWRSETVRLLQPAYSAHVKAGSSAESACEEQAGEFVTGPASYLMSRSATREQVVHRMQDLSRIFQHARELAIQLWAQRPAIRYRSLTSLRRMGSGSRFPLPVTMVAHPLHQLDDPRAISQDGASVKIVVHPAVLGFGTPEGERYDEFTVWARAVVVCNEGLQSTGATADKTMDLRASRSLRTGKGRGWGRLIRR